MRRGAELKVDDRVCNQWLGRWEIVLAEARQVFGSRRWRRDFSWGGGTCVERFVLLVCRRVGLRLASRWCIWPVAVAFRSPCGVADVSYFPSIALYFLQERLVPGAIVDCGLIFLVLVESIPAWSWLGWCFHDFRVCFLFGALLTCPSISQCPWTGAYTSFAVFARLFASRVCLLNSRCSWRCASVSRAWLSVFVRERALLGAGPSVRD